MRHLAHAPNAAAFPVGNAILAGLGASDLRMLEPIDLVRLPARWVLFDAGEPLRYLYFPLRGLVSFVELDRRGAMPEVAHIGAQGIVGLTGLFGAEHARQRAMVQIAGHACRVPMSSARLAFAQSATFQMLALAFAEVLIHQISRNVVCKLSHTVEQQFCQRLLSYTDCTGGLPLELTHEQIAEALGARRQGITEAARKLQMRQVIAYSRGRISVLDRRALESSACECYRVVREACPVGPPLP
jgi:CRP-like cAMP-binding protein